MFVSLRFHLFQCQFFLTFILITFSQNGLINKQHDDPFQLQHGVFPEWAYETETDDSIDVLKLSCSVSVNPLLSSSCAGVFIIRLVTVLASS